MTKRTALFILLLLTGCSAQKPLDAPVAGGYCDPPQRYTYNPAYAPEPDLAKAITPELKTRYPERALLAANACGILPQLRALQKREAENGRRSGSKPDPEAQRLKQEILAQVVLTLTTVASVAAELDCEGERADQLAGYLTEKDNQRIQRLTVLSIAVGAASGIGTTVIEDSDAQKIVGIAGGVATAALSILTLTGEHSAVFKHPRNLLAEIGSGKDASQVFPPAVWYMLKTPAFSNSGKTSIAHNTRQRWLRYDQLSKPDTKQGRHIIRLLFGNGGAYSADELKVRSNMINELQSAVRLFNQELQGLLLALNQPDKSR